MFDAGLHQCVEFAGQVDARGVRDVLRRAHALVLPSEFEGLPVSVIEALATGLPVIVTDGAPPELFPSYAGSRVPFGDSVALAAAMENIMSHYSSFDRGRIRDFAVERYDFRRVARRLVEVYGEYGRRRAGASARRQRPSLTCASSTLRAAGPTARFLRRTYGERTCTGRS